MAKIAISLPDEMLHRIDNVAEERQITRSELIRDSVAAYFEIERYRRTLARAQVLYAEIAEEGAGIAQAYRPLLAETLPGYHVEDGDK